MAHLLATGVLQPDFKYWSKTSKKTFTGFCMHCQASAFIDRARAANKFLAKHAGCAEGQPPAPAGDLQFSTDEWRELAGQVDWQASPSSQGRPFPGAGGFLSTYPSTTTPETLHGSRSAPHDGKDQCSPPAARGGKHPPCSRLPFSSERKRARRRSALLASAGSQTLVVSADELFLKVLLVNSVPPEDRSDITVPLEGRFQAMCNRKTGDVVALKRQGSLRSTRQWDTSEILCHCCGTAFSPAGFHRHAGTADATGAIGTWQSAVTFSSSVQHPLAYLKASQPSPQPSDIGGEGAAGGNAGEPPVPAPKARQEAASRSEKEETPPPMPEPQDPLGPCDRRGLQPLTRFLQPSWQLPGGGSDNLMQQGGEDKAVTGGEDPSAAGHHQHGTSAAGARLMGPKKDPVESLAGCGGDRAECAVAGGSMELSPLPSSAADEAAVGPSSCSAALKSGQALEGMSPEELERLLHLVSSRLLEEGGTVQAAEGAIDQQCLRLALLLVHALSGVTADRKAAQELLPSAEAQLDSKQEHNTVLGEKVRLLERDLCRAQAAVTCLMEAIATHEVSQEEMKAAVERTVSLGGQLRSCSRAHQRSLAMLDEHKEKVCHLQRQSAVGSNLSLLLGLVEAHVLQHATTPVPACQDLPTKQPGGDNNSDGIGSGDSASLGAGNEALAWQLSLRSLLSWAAGEPRGRSDSAPAAAPELP
mmetsp:Transcript_23563/g.65348  ORF Transcript_23563/g.65348 Transcript_23563/m.65348 type:complete len:702 (-) Transcript_23563:329-2434(-)